MALLAAKIVEGDYLTDGGALLYVLRVEDSGDVLAEDASTDNVVYLDSAEVKAHWKRVPHGA